MHVIEGFFCYNFLENLLYKLYKEYGIFYGCMLKFHHGLIFISRRSLRLI